MKKLIPLTLAAVVLSIVSARAQVISVQYGSNSIAFNHYTAGLVPETIWNSDTTTSTYFPTNPSYNPGLSNLVDSNGTTTTVGERTANDGRGEAITANTGFTNPGDAALFSSGVLGAYHSGGTDHTFDLTLSGLNNADNYDLIIYITENTDPSPAHVTAISPTGGTIDFSNTPSTQGSYVTTTGLNFDSANYLEYDNLSGSTLNTVSLQMTTAAGQGFEFDGFQLVDTSATPEPSTWAMMLGGLAALGFVARRKTCRSTANA